MPEHLPMKAVEWRVGPDPDGRDVWRDIRIVEMGQRDGTIKYAVTEGSWCANKDREWEHHCLPSSRDDAFLTRCRWDDWQDAAVVAQHMASEWLAGRWAVADTGDDDA